MRRHRVDHDGDLMAIDVVIPEIWDSTRLHDLACWAHTPASARAGRAAQREPVRHDHRYPHPRRRHLGRRSIHSDISFKVRHMGVGRVRGRCALASAALTVGGDGGRVTALIDAASIRTGNEQRDQHVRSADFLGVEKYPQIEFVSTEVRDFDGETFTLVGELTLHGVTRTVELGAEFLGVVAHLSDLVRTGFSATTTISRAAFGIVTKPASAPATSWSPTPSRSPSRSSSPPPDRTRDDPRGTPSYIPKGLET